MRWWGFLLLTMMLVCAGCTTGYVMGRQVIDPEQVRKAQLKAFEQKLNDKGIAFARVGENYLVVLPSDDLFLPRSANFNPYYLSNLNTIIGLMREYQITLVQVEGYTNAMSNSQLNTALAIRQAQKVIEYVAYQGIDARIISADGKTSENTYAQTGLAPSNVYNRRIEIKFQYSPPIYKQGNLYFYQPLRYSSY